jgi:hypothetical protein
MNIVQHQTFHISHWLISIQWMTINFESSTLIKCFWEPPRISQNAQSPFGNGVNSWKVQKISMGLCQLLSNYHMSSLNVKRKWASPWVLRRNWGIILMVKMEWAWYYLDIQIFHICNWNSKHICNSVFTHKQKRKIKKSTRLQEFFLASIFSFAIWYLWWKELPYQFSQ